MYFEEDTNILYGILEISATDLIRKFAEFVLKAKHNLLKGIANEGLKKEEIFEDTNNDEFFKNPKVEKYLTKVEKRLNLIQHYESLTEYLAEQTEFEVIASIHNGRERIMYFIDTRCGCSIISYKKPATKTSKAIQSEMLSFKFENLTE